MSERDANHLRMLRELDESGDPSERAQTAAWWWRVTEAERDSTAGMSAAAAREFDDPQQLYAYWRRDARTEAERRYVEDLVARVEQHLASQTGVTLSRTRHP